MSDFFFKNLLYSVVLLCAVAARRVVVSHPGPGSWLRCGRFALELYPGRQSMGKVILCCHCCHSNADATQGAKLSAREYGRNMLTAPENCTSSKSLAADIKQESSEGAPRCTRVRPVG